MKSILILLSLTATAFAQTFPTMPEVPEAYVLNSSKEKVAFTLLPHLGNLNSNPGFFDQFGNLESHASLQTCVDQIIEKRKMNHKNASIMLIDLTGKKLNSPEAANFSEDTMMYAASIAKTAVLVATHQLRHDLQALLSENSALSESELISLAKEKFGINSLSDKFLITTGTKGLVLDFSETLRSEITAMLKVSSNEHASLIIGKLGLKYIASVLWKQGLYNPNLGGGLWVGKAYGGGTSWYRDPLSNNSHGVNALALSRLYTLLSQKRLISASASESMLSFLYDSSINNKFIQGLASMGLKVNSKGAKETDPLKKVTIYRKTGTYDSVKSNIHVSHDGALIEREVCLDSTCQSTQKIRYVAVFTSKQDMALANLHSKVIKDLDQCIQENN